MAPQRQVSPTLLIAAVVLLLILMVTLVLRRPAPESVVVAHISPAPPALDADLGSVSLPFLAPLMTSAMDDQKFVGSESCSGCHTREAADHRETSHARTLRKADVSLDGAHFRSKARLVDKPRGLTYTPAVEGQRLFIRAAGRQGVVKTPVDLVLGSGVNGSAFFSLREGGAGVLCRAALVRRDGKLSWDWHPQLEPDKPVKGVEGREFQYIGISTCLSCHATTMPMHFTPDTARMGIGCERCHGPAKDHLAAVAQNPEGVRSGSVPIGIPRLGGLSSVEELALCNTCHRPLAKKGPDGHPTDLVRGQPLTLQMSRCYTQSGGRLRCSDCHNPHTNVEHKPDHYRSICMSCHSGSSPEKPPCPVQPKGKCVSCHMGKEKLTAFSSATFTSHWIRRNPASKAQ